MECQISENTRSKEIKTEILSSTETLSHLEKTVGKLDQHISHFSSDTQEILHNIHNTPDNFIANENPIYIHNMPSSGYNDTLNQNLSYPIGEHTKKPYSRSIYDRPGNIVEKRQNNFYRPAKFYRAQSFGAYQPQCAVIKERINNTAPGKFYSVEEKSHNRKFSSSHNTYTSFRSCHSRYLRRKGTSNTKNKVNNKIITQANDIPQVNTL